MRCGSSPTRIFVAEFPLAKWKAGLSGSLDLTPSFPPLTKWKNLVPYNISSVSKLKFFQSPAGLVENIILFGETETGQIFPTLVMIKGFSRNPYHPLGID